MLSNGERRHESVRFELECNCWGEEVDDAQSGGAHQQIVVLSKREPADPHPLPPNMSARVLLDAATPSPTMAPLPFGLSVNDADSMWLLIGAILVFFMRKLP